MAVDLSEILESLTYVLALCKQWIHREPDREDRATVYRTAALAETAAEVVPEAFRAQPRRPLIRKNCLDRRRSVSPLAQAGLAESELHRFCSLHLVDLAGVTHDDLVFEMTDHYFGQNYEQAPWDTWVWREGNYLVSRGAAKSDALLPDSGATHDEALTEVIDAWPELPTALQQAILVIVRAERDE